MQATKRLNLSYNIELWQRVIEWRLRQETNTTNNQYGFMPMRAIIKAIFLLRSREIPEE